MLTRPDKGRYDVVIVGGAKLGSSIAWYLSQLDDFDGSVLVVEQDPSYEWSATARTNSCMRQQFSSALNVQISQYAAEHIKDFRAAFGGDERVPDIAFDAYGYVYLAGDQGFAEQLRAAQLVQAKCGAATRLLSPGELQAAFPFYQLDDIVLGSHNPIDEGYYDGATVFEWWRRGAREAGVEYCHNRVVGLNRSGNRVASVVLQSGERVECGWMVNAAGTNAPSIANMAGLELPIEPRKRYTYVFSAERPLDQPLPLTIDPSGVHVRSDGANYLAGCGPWDDIAVAVDDFEEDHSLWQERVWPALAHRIPQFDALKVIQSWVGHYDFNTLDQNAIVGPHPEVANFVFANGFSGHGFQQAPAVGRGLAEIIALGEYRSLDLSPLGFTRIETNTPFLERAVI